MANIVQGRTTGEPASGSWWIIFSFRSGGRSCVCLLFILERDGSRMHYGKKADWQSQCYALANVGSWNSCDVTVTCITYLKIVVDHIHSKSSLTNSTQNATAILIKSHSIKRFQNRVWKKVSSISTSILIDSCNDSRTLTILLCMCSKIIWEKSCFDADHLD